MKSLHLDTNTSTSKLEPGSFLKDIEFKTLPSPQGEAPTTWHFIQEALRQIPQIAEVCVAGSRPLPHKAKMLVLAAVALDLGDEALLREVEETEVLRDYITDWRRSLDRGRVVEEALQVCIDYDLENVACHIVEKCTKLPLYLTHRAGEKGHLRFLKTVSDFKIQMCSSRTLASAAQHFMGLIHKPTHAIRFRSKSTYLLSEDVLRWAFINGNEGKTKEVLKWGLIIPDEELVKILLAENMVQLFEDLVATEKVRLSPTVTKRLLEAGQLHILLHLVEVSRRQQQRFLLIHRTPALLNSVEVKETLVAMVSDVAHTLSVLKLLQFIQKEDWSLVEIQNMYLKTVEMLDGFDLESSPFANHSNPLFLAVVLSETCKHFSRFQLQFQEKFHLMSLRFRDLAEKIQSQFTEYREVEVLYTERVFGKECLFDVMTANTEPYRSLLRSHIVVSIAQNLWDGGSHFESNFERLCLATRLLGSEGQEPFQVQCTHKNISECVFRLSEWKRNNTLKFIVEAIGLVLTYVTMVINLVCYTRVAQQLRDPNLQLADLIPLANQVDSIRNFSVVYNTFIWLMMLYLLQIWTYVHINGSFIIFQLKDLMDIMLFALAVLNESLGGKVFAIDLKPKELRAMSEPSFGLIFLVAGYRIMLTLLITRTFGPMIRMVFIVMVDVAVFLGIYLLALVSFSIFAHTMFYMEPEFSDIWVSLRTLYQWSLSGIDFAVFTEKTEWGSVLGVVWMFVSAVILLNLLIAVLSVRYEELAPQCTADYVSSLYRQYSLTHYTEPYGALVMAPAPLAVLTLPLLPLYFFFPRLSKRTNVAFVILTYQPLFLLGIFLFTLYSFWFSIIAYFYVAAKLIRSCKCGKLILWLFLGPCYLIWLILLSFLAYCRLMYKEDPPEEECLPPEVFQPAVKFLSVIGAHSHPCVLQISELQAVICRFPVLSFEKVVLRERIIARVLASVVQSQDRFSAIKRSQVKRFFEQFKSYAGTQDFEGEGAINLTRMALTIKRYSARPDKLASINIYYVQKALSLLRAEYFLKLRKGKSLSS